MSLKVTLYYFIDNIGYIDKEAITVEYSVIPLSKLLLQQIYQIMYDYLEQVKQKILCCII